MNENWQLGSTINDLEKAEQRLQALKTSGSEQYTQVYADCLSLCTKITRALRICEEKLG
ncbi:hypothetical protein HMPREF1862_00543 [Varibaculum cambriense]|uniref:Uncharacterized protein n=1 Tax=Varibaculum cambriense TaxID=184870 RepID=A0AB34X0I9_9ACTO|nr:hypothetical protein [Varibaculum cambriense]KXB81354.1 hypothetical protein HMPREF1862_00543 [Varibaculum cambriense]